jgi:predicted AAA+ superfamily ATPase
MIKRDIEPVVLKSARDFPVVTLIGPRQSGKTTLVKAVFPTHTYCNLENPEIRELARNDPKSFFAQFPAPLVIDEVQRVPELLSWIQVLSDESALNGEYILTGSHQLRLYEAVSQSLAGRTAILRLFPFSLNELSRIGGCSLRKEDMMCRGFLPRIYDRGQDPTDAYRSYFQTYVERDVRQLINLKNLTQFEQFIKLLAGRVGQLLNLSGLANEVGVSSTTLREWVSILEASFVIYQLPPYYRNFGKRLVKSQKLFFVETGLAAWLLGIETPEQILRDPLHGGLFENMVVMDALKTRLNAGREPGLYFWRDSKGHEVDLVFERQRRLIPIEIKSSMTWHRDFAKNIHWMQKRIPDVDSGHIVYAGDLFPQTEDYSVHSFTKAASIFMA